jgi:hypothetical protein
MNGYVVGHLNFPSTTDRHFDALQAAYLEAVDLSEKSRNSVIGVWTDDDASDLVALAYGGSIYE